MDLLMIKLPTILFLHFQLHYKSCMQLQKERMDHWGAQRGPHRWVRNKLVEWN